MGGATVTKMAPVTPFVPTPFTFAYSVITESDYRSDLNDARRSDTRSSGCSHAAKWPPLSCLL